MLRARRQTAAAAVDGGESYVFLCLISAHPLIGYECLFLISTLSFVGRLSDNIPFYRYFSKIAKQMVVGRRDLNYFLFQV